MIDNPYIAKREYFDGDNTKNYEFRLTQLTKLKDAIKKYENEIIQALSLDLGKPIYESYTAEIGIVNEEIKTAIKNLKNWMKAKRVSTPVYLQPGSSHIYPEPKGVVLIISPWNYPFQLAVSPLIGAIAAGNCVVLKPSNKSKHTEEVISKILKEIFDENYISVVLGPGAKTVTPLIEDYRFDHIFFTGSVDVGKGILGLAAKDLTPVTLELGGKSPVIVHEDADLDLAAKRITWAKFYNLGQTCIAPDYLLVHESKKEALLEKLTMYINKFYGNQPINSPYLGRIINDKQYDKLISLVDSADIILGGDYNREERYISPTLIHNVNMEDNIMKEEIFGPLLPILTYNNISEVVDIIRMNPYPLALYLFTKDKDLQDYFIKNIQFGGGCINHLITHVANSSLPFGGFGFSGMGNYHSKYTFDTFSHMKSIYKSHTKIDINMLYPPYTEQKLKLAKRFL